MILSQPASDRFTQPPIHSATTSSPAVSCPALPTPCCHVVPDACCTRNYPPCICNTSLPASATPPSPPTLLGCCAKVAIAHVTTPPLMHVQQPHPVSNPSLPSCHAVCLLVACVFCRIAARKCRAKKNALMTDLQATLAGLMRKNEEYKLQVRTTGLRVGNHRAVGSAVPQWWQQTLVRKVDKIWTAVNPFKKGVILCFVPDRGPPVNHCL